MVQKKLNTIFSPSKSATVTEAQLRELEASREKTVISAQKDLFTGEYAIQQIRVFLKPVKRF